MSDEVLFCEPQSECSVNFAFSPIRGILPHVHPISNIGRRDIPIGVRSGTLTDTIQHNPAELDGKFGGARKLTVGPAGGEEAYQRRKRARDEPRRVLPNR
jgi:hypothetical protein